MIIVFQSSCRNSVAICRVTLLSTSVKSYVTINKCSLSNFLEILTDTKKLEVPSERKNMSGKSFNQVSSPYISIPSSFFALICDSQVSCVAKVDVVSDSAKFNSTSRKDGIEPVVIAFTLGIVIVGAAA